MIRIAKPTDPRRIEELKKKINDSHYVNNAIHSIANILTKELLHLRQEE